MHNPLSFQRNQYQYLASRHTLRLVTATALPATTPPNVWSPWPKMSMLGHANSHTKKTQPGIKSK